MKKTAFDIVIEERKKLVNRIIENMEKGYFFTKNGWSNLAVLPQNPVSDLHYRGGNRFKLMLEAIDNNYQDPRWLTFKQAQENNWKIKKGAKGILCEKWIFTKKVKEKDEDGLEKEVEKTLSKPIVNYFIVFNAEQIEGIPPYSKTVFTKDDILKTVDNFIKSSEVKIREIAQPEAYYSPSKDEIVLPIRKAFKSEEAFMRTTLHEMCHSTGHESRLNRDQTGHFGTPSYAKEELVAELGSLFTETSLGFKIEGEHFNDHSNYLKSWIEALKNDYNELFRACSEAEKASSYLLERYNEYEKNKEKSNEKTNSKKIIKRKSKDKEDDFEL